MGISASIEIEDNSEEVRAALKEVLPVILEEWGLAAERFAKEECPVDTGRLMGSITYATAHKRSKPEAPAKPEDAMKQTPDESSTIIGTDVEYAQHVEFGTSRTKAHPFIRPAVENHIEEYKKIMQYHLTQD